MYILKTLAQLFAVLAGFLLTGITLMTCLSIVGRELIGQTLVGDFELSAAATGATIAMFMPWCQIMKGNIIVDFFTSKCKKATQQNLDRFGCLLLAICFAILAWRTTLGAISAYIAMNSTMILGFPEWIVYVCMAPAFLLTSVIAFFQIFPNNAKLES